MNSAEAASNTTLVPKCAEQHEVPHGAHVPFLKPERLYLRFCKYEHMVEVLHDCGACTRHRRTSKDTVPYCSWQHLR